MSSSKLIGAQFEVPNCCILKILCPAQQHMKVCLCLSINKCKITVLIILKQLQNIKIHKTSKPDKTLPKFLHGFVNILAEPLADIFDKSLETTTVPRDCRQQMLYQYLKRGKDINNQITHQSRLHAYAAKYKTCHLHQYNNNTFIDKENHL